MKLRSIVWIPLAILLAGCGESASERAAREAREARDAEDMLLLLGALVGGAQRPVQPNVNLDFEWQERQRAFRAMQSQLRWNIYDASGNRVGRIEPNYSPYP
ncbi:MAG TPA: hypothetical protein PLT00_12670 [Verrucomicrobiota bacterium]|jgi:hypothetical protein|nr:MAG: hypothetical protein BWX84_00257 [Verrucomicrobia bacterium ADurb.Bin118]HPY31127.1 hypothetical protein [Verrucomicrobiota bacterium]HQB17555.1 hypothetical protein [Verrucomicrobiota bacterium]